MSKYASLPDLDSSQDIYETPDLADDVSTLRTTIGARTTSPAFSDDDRDYHTYRPTVPQLAGHHRHHSTASAAALAESIDRTRLQLSTARGKFSATDVDASYVDFSDRVGRRSHGYVISSRKGRRRRGRKNARGGSESGLYYGEGGGSEGEDSGEESEDGEEETLEGRLARLRREVEELKVQVGEREEREERARRERKAVVGEEGAEEGGEEKGVTFPEEEEEEADTNKEGIDDKRLRTGIAELSGVLETIQSPSIKPITSHTRHGRAEANLARKIVSSLGTAATTQKPTDGPQELPHSTTTTSPTSSHSQPSYTITYAPSFHQSHSLARAADFDLRLTTLERLLGTTHSSTTHLSNLDKHLPANAIIPTLDDLARQISVLTSANQPFVEAVNRRVKILTEQAEKLAEVKRSATRGTLLEGASHSAPSASGLGGGGSGGPHVGAGVTRRATVSTALGGASAGAGTGVDDDSHSPLAPSIMYGNLGAIDTDRETKINALYGVLPTIQQLGPLLPSVLDRLRSLRAIHADAGRAAEGLEGIEKRQEEMSVEIKRWREALKKVEGVMKETEGVFMGNVGKVEEWVRGLEERMEKVERLYSESGEVMERKGGE
ncbi:Dynamitin-domain-containing protein [Tirmania nivea]|nr:Dynamitin-domain-containing protein [Tirmania nivea]